MDINYELYKVFYHVASSLSFSEASKQAFHFPVRRIAVDQDFGEKDRSAPLYPQHQKVQLTPAGELLLQHIEPNL